MQSSLSQPRIFIDLSLDELSADSSKSIHCRRCGSLHLEFDGTGTQYKTCFWCRIKRTCIHDLLEHHCRECGGEGICEHRRWKNRCSKCKTFKALKEHHIKMMMQQNFVESNFNNVMYGNLFNNIPIYGSNPNNPINSSPRGTVIRNDPTRKPTSRDFCVHNRQRYECRHCWDPTINSRFCEHRRNKNSCIDCELRKRSLESSS